MSTNRTHEVIRQCGGIVHSDGNIFFTNRYQFEHAASILLGVATVKVDDPLAAQELATQIAEAFADLPNALRAHPGVKRLYRAAVCLAPVKDPIMTTDKPALHASVPLVADASSTFFIGVPTARWVERCRHPGSCIKPRCGDFCYDSEDVSSGMETPTPD